MRPACSRLTTPWTSLTVTWCTSTPWRGRRNALRTLAIDGGGPPLWRSVLTTDQPARLVRSSSAGHVEAPCAQIDDRQHLTAQVDDAFEELRRPRQSRNLVGDAAKSSPCSEASRSE